MPYRERNPDKLLFTLEYPRQDIWRWLVAGDSVKTECDERVAQRRNEPARLAPVQQHERERDMFVRLHHKIPGMRIGVVSQWPPAYCRRDISWLPRERWMAKSPNPILPQVGFYPR